MERLSYMQSVEESYGYLRGPSLNPIINLKEAFTEVESHEPSHLKVYLRIRPLLSDEHNESKEDHVEILNDHSISLITSSHGQSHKNNAKISNKFTFSHVYGPDSSQENIFEQTTENLVNDVIKGQNCLLFTYGATNSGKTFTIQGTEKDPGLLPRTLVSLFNSIGTNQYLKEDLRPHHFSSVIRLSEAEIKKEREIKEAILKLKDFSRVSTCSNFSYTSGSSKDFDQQSLNHLNNTQASLLDFTQKSISSKPCYAVFVSFAEIYNEYVYDLLERIYYKSIKKTPLVLGEDKFGSIYIKGLKYIKVCSVEEVLQVLEVGRQNLHFASTQLNQNSSRSHCIFTIKLVQIFDPSNPHIANISMLSLCDLAGAERATKTLTSHDRLKEAGNINTSLLVLGRCIEALRHNQMVKNSILTKKMIPVPYRESKITRLFQSFFMGKGILSMIVNISSSTHFIDDTLRVLKFSAIARKVAIVPNKAYVDRNINRPYSRSRFSQFMRQSLNMSKGSLRFSVPWANSTTAAEVTFGVVNVEEVSECTTDEVTEESDSHEQLLELIKVLKDRLIKEKKDKQEMENNLRKEICDNLSQRILENDNAWRSRIEEERFRNEELMDWRVNRALETNDAESISRKRQRLSGDISHFEDGLKIQEVVEENDLLKQELVAVKNSLKSTINSSKLMQEEITKLTFQFSMSSQSFEKANLEKEKAENALRGALSGKQQVESTVIERQQQKITDLLSELQSKQEETDNVNMMLKEAAEEFIDKENKLANTHETLSQQNVILSDLENQLFEVKELLASQVLRLEERERTIFELQAEISKSKMADKSLKKQENTGSEIDQGFKSPQGNMQKLLFKKMIPEDSKNQSLIDFECTETKINVMHLQTEQVLKLKLLEECVTNTELKYTKVKQELKTSLEKEVKLLMEIELKDNKIGELESLEKQMEELREENNGLKLTISEKSDEEKNILSRSLINNQDLSRSGEAPPDEEPDLGDTEEIEELRHVLETLKLNSIQDVEEAVIKSQSQLEEMSKKYNECDEELLSMCKLNETLQNEVLANRNRINIYESEILGVKNELALRKDEVNHLRQSNAKLIMDTKLNNCNVEKEFKKIHCELLEVKATCEAYKKEIDEMDEKERTQRAIFESYKPQLEELEILKIKDKDFDEKKRVMEELSTKMKNDIKALEDSLHDKSTLVSNLTNKMATLDKKLDENENSNAIKTNEIEVLNKQLAAISEARKEELQKFETAIEIKEFDISLLQKALKENIVATKTDCSQKSIKEEEDNVHFIEEQLRKSELERSSMASQLVVLEKELSDKSESFKKLEAELVASKSNRTMDVADQSFMELVTPVPRVRATRGRSAAKNKTVQFTEYDEDSDESKSRTHPKTSKRHNVTFHDALETPSLQTVESSGEETAACSTRRSTRKTRGRRKNACSVANPHIPDNKENYQRSTRKTVKRRPLYNYDDQTLDGSPNLKDHEQEKPFEESPHTISRRQLRSKIK